MQALEAALESERAEFQQRLADKDTSIDNVSKELQAELDSLKDEKEDLFQRLRISERQLARLKRPKVCRITSAMTPMMDAGQIWQGCVPVAS
jgi:flagellar motility protein MotE (MotC chaperone)